MLSDEERKVMDSLKVISEYAGDNYLAKEHRRKLKLLIELVEKQAKEIEELNKSDESKEQSSMNYYNLYKELVDKIKAKIEELDYNDIGNFERRCKQEVLQSLLEKEVNNEIFNFGIYWKSKRLKN